MRHFTFILLILLIGADKSKAQNFIDKYLTDPLAYTTIASSTNGISQPRDLDFKPNSNELWIANYGTGSGGSNVIIYNAGQSNQTSEYRMDSHAGHFFMYPSALAFSDIGEWASTSEIKNTASPASTFMGPALWSGDTSIHVRVFQNNWQAGFPLGSHLDMLHQSPFAMGIAHEENKIYWVFDGWNGNLCRYDFGIDHGPGYDDHSDGRIWRHTDVSLTMVPSVPSHMVMDKVSKWLYIINGGPKTLMRVNTATGVVGPSLAVPITGGEFLALYRGVTGATKETIDTYATQPCGVDYYNDRLVVSDYTNGDIYIYNTAAVPTPTLMGTIGTGQPGIMGVKIGYDGKIWFVNHAQNTVVRIDPTEATNDVSVTDILSPRVANFDTHFHYAGFNVCDGAVAPAVRVKNEGTNSVSSMQLNYTIDGGLPTTFAWTGSLAPGATTTISLPMSIVADGEHKIHVFTSSPNGSADGNALNDGKEGSFRIRDGVRSLPFLEDFSLPQFPPSGWSYIGFNRFCEMSREANLGAYWGTDGCLKMDNSSGGTDITGQTDYFLSPRIDLSATGAGTSLDFDIAYAQYSGSTNDRLDIKVTDDCGLTWTTVYDKAGSALATAAPVTSVYYPDGGDWRTDAAGLDQFIGKEIMILFTATSNFGNNFYLDNIKIMPNGVGIQKSSLNTNLSVYPSPASDRITVKTNDRITKVELINVLGQIVQQAESETGSQRVIDISELKAGTYFVRVHTAMGPETRKIVIEK